MHTHSIRAHAHMHTCMRKHASHTHTHTHTHPNITFNTHTTYTHTHAHTHAHMHARTHAPHVQTHIYDTHMRDTCTHTNTGRQTRETCQPSLWSVVEESPWMCVTSTCPPPLTETMVLAVSATAAKSN